MHIFRTLEIHFSTPQRKRSRFSKPKTDRTTRKSWEIFGEKVIILCHNYNYKDHYKFCIIITTHHSSGLVSTVDFLYRIRGSVIREDAEQEDNSVDYRYWYHDWNRTIDRSLWINHCRKNELICRGEEERRLVSSGCTSLSVYKAQQIFTTNYLLNVICTLRLVLPRFFSTLVCWVLNDFEDEKEWLL